MAAQNPPPDDSAELQPEIARVLLPSPIGTLGAEFRDRIATRIVIAPSRKERRQFVSLKEAGRSDFLDEALGRMSEYFVGARKKIGLDFDLDVSDLDPFARRVLEETCEIPYGETRSYQKMASLVGRPDAYRLVRSVLMSNPLPILVPCHRVVPRRAGAGTYIAGTKRKDWLLKLEAKNADGG